MLDDFLFPLHAVIEGFIITISVIVSFGLQNTYVLRQGILGRHVLAAALTCAFCDYLLIILGSIGLGSFFVKNEVLRQGALIGGILFLGYYGLFSWLRAYRGNESSANLDGTPDVASVKRTILIAMAFTFFNPLALIETIVIVGGYSTKFPDIYERVFYTLGSMAAATVWFLSLGYMAKLLRPLFVKPTTGRVLDFIVGLMMLAIAVYLVRSEFLGD